MKPLLLLLLSVLAPIPALASPAGPDSDPGGFAEWKLVTKQNFSSQIRHHPHILLLVTLPWSGESRSLMKEIAHSLHKRKEEFRSLMLMLMYKNVEKMLADAIGASQETTIMYYHHSTSYKYRGRLRAQNILWSLRPYLTVPPENLPLEHINFEQDLKSFLESTDRALLLLEFCGWGPELLIRGRKNSTEHGYGSQGDIGEANYHEKTDRMSAFIGNEKQKVAGQSLANGVQQCGIQNGFYGIPFLEELSLVGDSSTTGSTEYERDGAEASCNFEEFQQFESFFSKFMTAAREFLLPPERHRFGLITSRSLLLSLGVGEINSWSAMIIYAGCPSCSKYLEKEEDLERFLQIEDVTVAELEDGERNLEPALPANKPSILLFVDRSSDSSETRIMSKEALNALRELALQFHIPSHMHKENKEEVGNSAYSHLSSRSMHRHPGALRSTSRHPKLKLSQSAQSVKSGEKVSIMIVNEEKHLTLDKITTDMQGSSLREVLENLLQKNKVAKLSSLAKEAGFQLLSDDFDIKIANPLSSQPETQPNQASVELSKEDLVSQIDRDQEVMDVMSTSAAGLGENMSPTGSEPLHYNEEKTDTANSGDDLSSAKSEQVSTKSVLENLKDIRVDEILLSREDKSRELLPLRGLEGSFYFLDGNYRLLKALTGGLKVPSLVIIDPIMQSHYLFPDQMDFSYTLLANFLNGFLNGSLPPYQHSESLIPMPRDAASPPFVNLDFHEANSIPRIAAKTFYELVFGFNHSETRNAVPARQKDMLVLFSNGWCGFSQRMELVVREVHRALSAYMNMLSHGSQNAQTRFSSGGSASYEEDNMEDMAQKLPLVYLMDCTLNDCSLIFKAMNKRELYPALVFFPAENKTSVSYDGDMAVAPIVKFLADHGSNSDNLINEKGILWTPPAKFGMGQNSFSTPSSNVVGVENLIRKDQLQNFLLQEKVSPKSKGPDGAASSVVAGSILVATEKLLGMHPFDDAMILIVKADKVTGFQGVIINKPISWDLLHELEQGSEFLKEAPLFLGGPLVNRGLPLVSLTRASKSQYLEILPGVRFIDQLETIREINELRAGNATVADYWFFLGYASWVWDQLFNEIDEGAWNVNQDTMEEFAWPRP